MSQSQTGMEIDVAESSPGTADVAMQEAAQTSPITEEGASARNIVIQGGEFKKPVFGDQIKHHHVHHHYHVQEAPGQSDQPGTSSGRPAQTRQIPPRTPTEQENQGAESEDRIVPPQQGQESDEGNVRKLTDTLFVDMNVRNRLSKTAFVYPGFQSMGELCPPRLTAVKIVQYEKSRKREARNLLKLTPHSNVVLVIHADLLPGSPILKQIYIVMEQCQPLTLEEYIENRKMNTLPFNTKQALDFARQIISGMKHIHDKAIVHRDLKPSSVLFSLDGRSLKIIDFGVSKELENGLTTMSVSTRIGTDGYRAPETYKDKTGKHMKKPADVFSLGILLCHIWSYGLHPFGEDGTLWAHNIKKGNSPDLTKLLIPEPEKAKEVLWKMLKVNQDERYTMDEIEKHEYIHQGVESALLSEMDNVWNGQIKVSAEEDTHPFGCKLYERKEKNILELREQSAQFQMLYVPLTRMTNTVEGVVNVPPNGYVAVSKDVYLKRLKKKFGKQMGWINAFKNKDRIGAFIIFQPRGYEELVCIFIEKPEEFLNRLRVATAAEETVPKEPAPGPEPLPEEEIPEEVTPALQPTTDESEQPAEPYQDATADETPHHGLLRAIQGDFEDRPENDEKEEEPSISEETSASREVEIGQPEYIAWWLYRPINPSEQASAQTGQ